MDENNQIDENVYNEKSLYLLNIKQLRAMGRRFGVPSPASKKKKELVDYILNVVYGKVEVPARTSYGRPSTSEFDMDEYLEKIEKNYDVSGKLKNMSFSKNLGYATLSNHSEPYIINDNIERRVFCDVDGKYFLRLHAFLESEDDILISENIVKKYCLENYDVVEIVKIDSSFKIFSINGQKIREKIGKIYVDGKELRWGQKQDFYLSTKEELKDSIQNLIKDAEKNDIKIVILAENEYNCSGQTNLVKYTEKEDKSQMYKKLMMIMGICEKSIIDGEDLILCIEDSDIISNTISQFDDDMMERMSKYFRSILKKFVELGNICVSYKLELNLKY